MGQHGWPFASVDSFPKATDDPLYNSQHVKDLYLRANPHYEGRFTVPVLWDKKTHTIVNNESSQIIRIFNSAFNKYLPEEKQNLDYYPERLQKKIDELNDWIYSNINSKNSNFYCFWNHPSSRFIDGVYRAGFATTQEAYDKAVKEVFNGLDKVEAVLTESGDYLLGDTLTEADVRLWVSIVCSVSFCHATVYLMRTHIGPF